jgi:4-amino-4-deoxy-L-arabinose transferase-like glycosyltransferase
MLKMTNHHRLQNTILLTTIVFCVALILRFIHIYFIFQNSPFFDILPGDLGSYDRWATKIVQEGWMGKEIFYQDPLYPYFLALVYKTIGRDFLWVYSLQAVFGGLTAAVIFLMGERTIGRSAGIIGGLLYACYSPAIYFDGLLLKVTLSAFLITMSVYFLLGNKPESAGIGHFLSGIFLGLAILTRANFLLIFPVVILIVLLTNTAVFRKRVFTVLLFILGNLLILTPVLIRNYVVTGDVVLTTAQAGSNFFMGQHPEATGTYPALSFVRADPLHEQKDFQREAEKRLQRPLKPSEVSKYWFGEGLAFIRDKPGAFLSLTGKKLLLFMNDYEIADNHNFYFHKRYSGILKWLPFTFGLIGPFFLLGIFTLMRERGIATTLLFFIQVTYILSVILFYVFSRYRMPLLPVICLTAGYAVYSLFHQIRNSQWKPVVVKACAVAGAFILVNYQVMSPFDFSHSYTDEAIAYELKGDFQRAVISYEEALQTNPNYVRALERLGRVQMRLRHFKGAEKTYQTLLSRKPDSREARVQLLFLQQLKQQ